MFNFQSKSLSATFSIFNSLRNKIILGASVLVVLLICVVGWYYYNLRPVNAANDQAIVFEIVRGQSASSVAQSLHSQGLIRNQPAFLAYITLRGIRFKIQAGEYSISPAKSSPIIASILAKGQVDRHQLIIPEGLTNQKIVQLATSQGINQAEFKKALSAPYPYAFLKSRPASVDLEGYLFPDSYQMASKPDPSKLVSEMLENFNRRVTPDLISAFSARGLSLHGAVTLASIVEKEVAGKADRALVAGVFYNRLRLKMPLESDVTVIYAAEQMGTSFSTKLDSLYNTYKYPGLPVGPICNPGLSALSAVANPTPSDYLYFLAGKDGITYFAKTFAEHEKNIQLHLK